MDIVSFLTQQQHQAKKDGKKKRKPTRADIEAKQQREYRAMRHYSNQLDTIQRQSWRQHTRELSQLSPEEIAEKTGRHCLCGQLLVPKIQHHKVFDVERPLIIWPDDCGCGQAKAQFEQVEKEREQERQQIQAQLHKHRLQRAGLVGWLEPATFDNFVEIQEQKKKVLEYADKLFKRTLPDKNWLVLCGNIGTGKSHLAAALIHRALEEDWPEVYFRSWTQYLKRLKDSWQRDKKTEIEAEVIRELQQGSLIVVDDLDKVIPSDWAKSILYLCLNYRYNNNLPTVFTFNYKPSQTSKLEQYLGKPVFDRILGKAYNVIEFTDQSYRSGIKW